MIGQDHRKLNWMCALSACAALLMSGCQTNRNPPVWLTHGPQFHQAAPAIQPVAPVAPYIGTIQENGAMVLTRATEVPPTNTVAAENRTVSMPTRSQVNQVRPQVDVADRFLKKSNQSRAESLANSVPRVGQRMLHQTQPNLTNRFTESREVERTKAALMASMPKHSRRATNEVVNLPYESKSAKSILNTHESVGTKLSSKERRTLRTRQAMRREQTARSIVNSNRSSRQSRGTPMVDPKGWEYEDVTQPAVANTTTNSPAKVRVSQAEFENHPRR